ncbi:hypothetical protein Dimus_008316, partial [Dionaea muscipula]
NVADGRLHKKPLVIGECRHLASRQLSSICPMARATLGVISEGRRLALNGRLETWQRHRWMMHMTKLLG